MEWVMVTYPRTRDVFVDGELCGQTNVLMAVGPGTQRIDLGEPIDYTPRQRTVTVTGTSPPAPREVAFLPKS